jgi:hypothetical protein
VGRRAKYITPPEGHGKTVHVYLPPASLKIARQIENFSSFVQIALSQAVGIMEFDLLKKMKPEVYQDPWTGTLEELIPQFNANHPHDPLTAKRKIKRENLANPQELW